MQKKQWFRKGMAGVLAALMLTQSVSLTAFAAEYTEDVAAVQAEVQAEPQLQNGTAVIPGDATEDEVKEILCKALVANAEDVDAQSLEWEYYCQGKNWTSAKKWNWGSVFGFETGYTSIDKYTYPALAANEDGSYQVRLAGTETAVTLTKAAKLSSSITLKEGCTVTLPYTADIAVDFDALRQNIFNTVVASTTPELTLEDVTIEYYAENVVLGKPAGTHEWAPLEGGTIKNTIGIPLEYPAISAGDQEIRISYAGTDTVYGTSAETAVTIAERPQVQFNLNEGPYEVGMVFTNDQGYDYKATAAAIYKAVVASTENPANLTADEVKVEYNASLTPSISEEFKPLDGSDWIGLKKFGTGTWEIRISWPGNQEYKGNSVTVSVTTTDSRAASTVALKSGASFTYNMDAEVMKQAIFDNVIDWENSALPAKETLSADNFVIEYYGENILPGDINGGVKQWAPIAGGMVNLLTYPQMGAGEQQIRISFKGSADYRPSENTEGTVTVNKAKVTVKVNSTNIYADESLPESFITTDPADTFDMYTIYAGVTSNVTTGIYLDLPERYTDSAILKLLDPIVENLYGKSFTQMLNDGVTVGELRELFSTQELLDLLDKLNIDTGTFGQILTVINKLPGILDSVRISFGTPNRAGLYTVAAVTDNKNYETGVGMGFLLVKMRFSGPKLTWNQEISGGKLTAEQAKNFDFGATLSYNGDTTVDQSGVHYLYSGFTSKWKIYSSTTTPPTEPGRYVVTVCILGGNYMAAPITRSFQITK